MLKAETVYREILESRSRLSQLELSRRLRISLSTVNNALKPLAEMGAIGILRRGVKITDAEKMLLYWASVRDLGKDIVYSTRADAPPSGIEKGMPPRVAYTAYSAYKFRFGDVPADYSEVYVYSEDVAEIKRRFPPRAGPPNLFVLKPDGRLFGLAKDDIAPLSQVFVDLWNVKEWYAREFAAALKERILLEKKG